MNDQSTSIDEAPPHGIARPHDPDYIESMHDTQVTQRLVDKLQEMYADAGEEDSEILKQTLSDLAMAYDAIRPDGPHRNVWDMDIC